MSKADAAVEQLAIFLAVGAQLQRPDDNPHGEGVPKAWDRLRLMKAFGEKAPTVRSAYRIRAKRLIEAWGDT